MMGILRREYVIVGIVLVLAGLAVGTLIFSSPGSNKVLPSGGVRYQEIVGPSGFVNTDGITIRELIGQKIVLVDFMTYSCINCQRTFPYLNAWYGKYKDQGLEIIGIHTPEFAFEKDIDNVREAMKHFGISYPVVLDNDYATWNAYGNRYWPRKYLIDIQGNVVYDHIGEGDYEETEMKIRELLEERAQVLGENISPQNGLAAAAIPGSPNPPPYPGPIFRLSQERASAERHTGPIGRGEIHLARKV